MEVGRTLRKAREEQHLSAREIAERLGLSRSYVTLMEAGKKPIKVELLFKWAKMLGYQAAIRLLPLESDHSLVLTRDEVRPIVDRANALRGPKLYQMLRFADLLVRANPDAVPTIDALLGAMDDVVNRKAQPFDPVNERQTE